MAMISLGLPQKCGSSSGRGVRTGRLAAWPPRFPPQKSTKDASPGQDDWVGLQRAPPALDSQLNLSPTICGHKVPETETETGLKTAQCQHCRTYFSLLFHFISTRRSICSQNPKLSAVSWFRFHFFCVFGFFLRFFFVFCFWRKLKLVIKSLCFPRLYVSWFGFMTSFRWGWHFHFHFHLGPHPQTHNHPRTLCQHIRSSLSPDSLCGPVGICRQSALDKCHIAWGLYYSYKYEIQCVCAYV